MKIRRVLTSESGKLSTLAFRSKKIWGYDDNFMAQCRQELTLSAQYICQSQVYVLEEAGHMLGFYGMSGEANKASMDFLFIDPDMVKRGYGKQLWLHAVNKAAELGFNYILIEADPNAKGFYQAMGAELTGEVPSGSISGRVLPLLCFTIK